MQQQNRMPWPAEAADDRRAAKRLPIERCVRYRVLGANAWRQQVGSGKTLNISSQGALFTTESALPAGVRVELAVSWPALLHDSIPMKLVFTGRITRSAAAHAAMCIEKYEFKTHLSNGMQLQ